MVFITSVNIATQRRASTSSESDELMQLNMQARICKRYYDLEFNAQLVGKAKH